MATRRVNPRLIKLHRTYAVDEAARTLGVHKNSVRSWIKSGLPTIDKARPVLMLGRELRQFLEGQRKARRRPTPPGHIYCFKCREHSKPAGGMADYLPFNSTTGNLQALCDTCGTVMNRRARQDSLPVIMPGLAVQIRQAPSRISGRA